MVKNLNEQIYLAIRIRETAKHIFDLRNIPRSPRGTQYEPLTDEMITEDQAITDDQITTDDQATIEDEATEDQTTTEDQGTPKHQAQPMIKLRNKPSLF